MPDDTIVIKAPAGTKARWVRAAQRHGLKLSDYIVRSVDLPANKIARIGLSAVEWLEGPHGCQGGEGRDAPP